MKSKEYEYGFSNEEIEISPERKKEMLDMLKEQLTKGFIAHYQILSIGKNDAEYDFLYEWLDNSGIKIRGLNGTISGEISNYLHMPRMGQSFMPDTLDDEEQERLFLELNKFSSEDKKNNLPEYLDIRNKLIEHNMRLAKWIANFREIEKIPVPYKDKQQIAMLALIKAVDKFNPSLGYKFSPFALKVIYRKIIGECFKYREIKYAMIMEEQLAMISEIENEMLITENRKPKPYEIADILGISVKTVSKLIMLKEAKKIESYDEIMEDKRSIETILAQLDDADNITRYENQYTSDGVYYDESDLLPLGFRITDRVADQAMFSTLKEQINRVLQRLPEREERCLKLRFGLIDGNPKTQEEIGEIFGVTGTRISQIEARALGKLRYPPNAKYLRDFYDDIGQDDR